MRPIRSLLLLLVPALVLAGCGFRDTARPGSSPTASESASEAPAQAVSKVVASSAVRCPSNRCVGSPDPADLWIYDAASGGGRRLTDDGDRTAEDLPQFASADEITFVTHVERDNGVFWSIPASGGTPEVLVRAGRVRIDAYAWSPDGETLAILASPATADEDRVMLWRRGDAGPRTIRLLVSGGGRGVGPDDDVHVAWSPEGSTILVTNTFLEKENVFVMRPDGTDVVPARDGAFARWLGEGATFVYRQGGPDGAWATVTVPQGTETPLAMRDGAYDPAVSPDGTRVAYHDGTDAPTSYVFDLRTKTERAAGAGVVPIWIGRDTLAATEARACAGDECGEAPPWVPTGRTVRLSGPGTDPATVPIPWTVNAATLVA